LETKTFAFHANHMLIANLMAALGLFAIFLPEIIESCGNRDRC